jgi:RNA 3'-terminal phosphate cyclase (ATP)
MLVIDGSYGEGGGQILRTSLGLAAILSLPIRIKNIRAGRKSPGLAAQHLTAVRAAAMICNAQLSGDVLGSTTLTFEPKRKPIPGLYFFDVAEAREGGSAGAATLILQTVLLPLALADQPSTVTIKGGTHVPWSPSFHYLQQVYLPMLAKLGLLAETELLSWGWYPAGGGELTATISGQARLTAALPTARGPLQQIQGIAVAANLPAHIAQRMCNRTVNLLAQASLPATLEPQRIRSVSPGAGVFLVAEYEHSRAGFTALGELGKPSERVAEEAVEAVLAFQHSEAVIDAHLADQLVLPLALANQAVTIAVEQVTKHTLTNLWVVEQILGSVALVDQAKRLIHFQARSKRYEFGS